MPVNRVEKQLTFSHSFSPVVLGSPLALGCGGRAKPLTVSYSLVRQPLPRCTCWMCTVTSKVGGRVNAEEAAEEEERGRSYLCCLSRTISHVYNRCHQRSEIIRRGATMRDEKITPHLLPHKHADQR